jgi:hypothetical protein
MFYFGDKIFQYNEKFPTNYISEIPPVDDKNFNFIIPMESYYIAEPSNLSNEENFFYKANTYNDEEIKTGKRIKAPNSMYLREGKENKFTYLNNILYHIKDTNDILNNKPKFEEDNETKKGRRKKYILYKDEAKHTKFNEDNIMRKIKGFIFRYILDLLNKSLISTKYKFYPLKAELSENLKKDLNEDLLKRKISDIFENTEINKKNFKFENPNKKLIRKILKEEIEPQTIFILNLSFNDILDFIRENDSENFLEKIREKELKNEGDEEYVEEYMKEVSRLLNGYEKWFEKKLSRNSKKRINKKKQKYMF